jgi:hypothetical protein
MLRNDSFKRAMADVTLNYPIILDVARANGS